MNEYGFVWVDITPDFDPVVYAESFADEDQAKLIKETESIEDSLRALYEWGYLSKRDGRIQLLVPEDALDEDDMYGPKEKLRSKAARAPGRAWKAAKAGGDVLRKGAEKLHRSGRATALAHAEAERLRHAEGKRASKLSNAAYYGRGVYSEMSKGQKLGLGAASLTAAGLAARELYKKMKAKKEKKESLDDVDFDEILKFAESIGFEFEDQSDLDETLAIGEYLDTVLRNAEEAGLAEDFSEEDIIEAALEETVDEAFSYEKALMSKKPKRVDMAREKVKAAAKYVSGKAVAGAKAVKGRMGAIHTAGKEASEFGKDIVSKSKTSKQYLGGIGKALSKKEKIGLGLAGGVGALGAGLAAKAFYKRMKKRKEQNENLDADYLDKLIQDSIDLGFEFENYDELLDSLYAGEYLDNYLTDAVAEGLTEDYDESDLVIAAIEELSEADVDDAEGRLARAKKWLAGAKGKMTAKLGSTSLGKAHTRGKSFVSYDPNLMDKTAKAKEYVKGAWGDLSKKGKVGVVGGAAAGSLAAALAARAAYRKMKKRKEESNEFTGYRSSASGGAYESVNEKGPIPFGTGNKLFETRIVDTLWDKR